MNDKTKRVSVGKNLLSYYTAVRGHWVFKASVWNDHQILVVGHNELTSEFFTRIFTDYTECVKFLEIMTFEQLGSSSLFPKFMRNL
jgi:hypothetical protein